MNPILFIGLTLAACAVAHYSVAFLEPGKSSLPKAIALNVVLVMGSNVARWSGFTPEPMWQWALYIAIAASLVRALYRLKFLNSVTVGASYVSGSYVLALIAST